LEAKVAAEEAAEWSQGAKGGNARKEAEAAKKAEAAAKKAERDALLKEEESSLPSKPLKSKQRGQEKVANRRAGKLDDFITDKEVTLSASGIDDALDALAISTGGGSKSALERHPERRYKAAHIAYEERRLPQIKQEHPGLRLNQYKELLHKEFEKSEENPFNQVSVDYNANKDEVTAVKQNIKRSTEKRLAHE